jgi:hypothetical protein
MGVSAYKQGCFACVYRATFSFSVASSNCQRRDSVGCCPNASAFPERLGCPLLHMLYLTVNSSVAGMATICKRRFQSVYPETEWNVLRFRIEPR